MPASISAATHSSVVRAASAASSSAASSGRLAIRSSLVAKRGSARSSSRPITAHSRSHGAALLPPTVTYPSLVRSAW